MSSGGSSPAGTTTTTVNKDPWSVQQPFLEQGFGAAQQEFQQGPAQFFPDSTVIPFSQQTESALGLQEQRALGGSPLMGAAQNTLQSTIQGDFLNANPYRDEMFDALSGRVQSTVGSQFARAGRTGSGGHQEATARALGDLGSQIYFADYARERGTQQDALGMAPGFANQDYFDIGQLANVGAAREGLGEQQLSDLISRWNFAQGSEQQNIADYMGLIGGGYGGTQTTAQPFFRNRGAGILGGAATGAGVGSLFGQPGLGALGGGLLGLF